MEFYIYKEIKHNLLMDKKSLIQRNFQLMVWNILKHGLKHAKE